MIFETFLETFFRHFPRHFWAPEPERAASPAGGMNHLPLCPALTEFRWSQSSGSNVIPRWARPGLAGLRPHSLPPPPIPETLDPEPEAHHHTGVSRS